MNGPLTALASKEFRALLPVWAAAAFTIGADSWLRGMGLHWLFPVGTFAYIVRSLALGAHVIGHEFTNRTLASLLVQPCRRSSMLLIKASVLAVMLMALGFIARVVLFRSLAGALGNFPRYPTLYLPVIGGLCVAPYLTMRLRSQMAGVLFATTIPGLTYLLALLGGVIIYGTGTAAAETLALAVWMPAMWIFAAAGAVLSARSFMQLQDTEGGREELRLPRWFTVTDASPTRPPLWMLAKKELRLQQITFAMVAVYALIWTGLTVAGRLNVDFAREFPMRAAGMLYFALLPLLMGSLASAQERHFGMLQSQPCVVFPSWVIDVHKLAVELRLLAARNHWTPERKPKTLAVQVAGLASWPLLIDVVATML